MFSKLKKVRERGIILSFEILFNRFVPKYIFRFSVGNVLELDLPRMCESWSGLASPDFSVHCVDDLQKRSELRKFTWNAVPPETTKNDIGYVISKSGENESVLGGVWIGVDDFIEADLGFRMELSNKQAWLYCAYISEKARGLGVYKRLLSFVGHDVSARGFERMLVVIQPWNKASLGVHERFLQKRIGRICVVRILSLSFVFCTGEVSKNGTLTANQLNKPIPLRVA